MTLDLTLDQQIEALIREAPQDGATPAIVAAIAPVLKSFAEQLKHTQYYVLQNLSEQWLSTTIQQEIDSELNQKTVVYGYTTLKEASTSFGGVRDPELMALPMPVIDILFRLNGMEGVDSTIFFDIPGNFTLGVEVYRSVLNDAIQQQLTGTVPSISTLPPDIA